MTERLVAGVEQGTTRDVQRLAAQSGWVDASRHGKMDIITARVREVLQENRSKPDNRGMMSEYRFDGVIDTLEFKNLTDHVAQVAQGLHS